ncbi:DUF5908 family protein [Nostoc sp. MS1]|uniref:DUF5908 family protein n=1 Tax=Nostoc sp. MS1 TaxID=2764711 RepID=UPI001CC4D689|nr:DUF5908 family protein [Nostoc sp. MS1]BCL33729.1 hypothetical protein NSMS1_01760 [Nostoc sp. MS1]
MPLEIRELVIKASINEGGQQNYAQDVGNFDADVQAAIIATCVEQVLAILKEKSER